MMGMDTDAVLERLRKALAELDTDTDTRVEVSPADLRHLLDLVDVFRSDLESYG